MNTFWSIINGLIELIKGIFGANRISYPALEGVEFYSPEAVKEALLDREVQEAMATWVKNNLRPLENNEVYLKTAKGNLLDRLFRTDTDTIKTMIEIMRPFILLGTPAHDLGHHIMDALGGSAIISNDPFVAMAHRNEIDASFFAAMFHDASTGVQHRYVDNEWELNHGELAAVIFFMNSKDVLPLNVRLLTAYAIAAHPHMIKELTAKNGLVRKPWVDELFWDENDRPVRLAVWITRWTDRLENGGDPATHLPRHAMASVDGARVGGLDLHHIDWYSFQDALKYLFTPKAIVTELPVLDADGNQKVKDGVPVVTKIPSMLQHLQGYANSAMAVPHSPYNQHDNCSPNMGELMAWKVAQSQALIDTVTNTTGKPNFDLFVELMKVKSGFPLSETGLEAIQMVKDLWDLNTPEDQAHWAGGFEMALESYYKWLTILEGKIEQATDPTIKAFVPLLAEMTRDIK
ncbi:MAG TPA: hypothetical protein VLH94_02975 [Spirochaetia bacterium]|nr:hypothetical protein [Spirochaetia bacterium]